MKPRDLPSHLFVFGNYGADIPFAVYMDDKELVKWLKKQIIVGYTETPSFKPIVGEVAIMIRYEQDDDREYDCWSHIPERIIGLL